MAVTFIIDKCPGCNRKTVVSAELLHRWWPDKTRPQSELARHLNYTPRPRFVSEPAPSPEDEMVSALFSSWCELCGSPISLKVRGKRDRLAQVMLGRLGNSALPGITEDDLSLADLESKAEALPKPAPEQVEHEWCPNIPELCSLLPQLKEKTLKERGAHLTIIECQTAISLIVESLEVEDLKQAKKAHPLVEFFNPSMTVDRLRKLPLALRLKRLSKGGFVHWTLVKWAESSSITLVQPGGSHVADPKRGRQGPVRPLVSEKTARDYIAFTRWLADNSLEHEFRITRAQADPSEENLPKGWLKAAQAASATAAGAPAAQQAS